MKGMLNTTDELNRRLCLGWSGRRDGGREEAKGGRGRAAATSAQLPHRHPEGARESFSRKEGRRRRLYALTALARPVADEVGEVVVRLEHEDGVA